MTDSDLPEGVIDADPPGGWSDGATADAETAAEDRAAEGSPGLTTAAHDAESEAAADGVDVGDVPDGPVAPDAPVESARLEADMDADLTPENTGDTTDTKEQS